MANNDTYIKWLNNAYAMERNIANTLKGQVDDMGDYLEIKEAINNHIEVTENQAVQLKYCIERNGGSVSSIKGGMASAVGGVNSFLENFAPDKPVSYLIADYATEHMEMATYRSLIEAAKNRGDDETQRVLEEILQQEEEMASRTEKVLPGIVNNYLQERQ